MKADTPDSNRNESKNGKIKTCSHDSQTVDFREKVKSSDIRGDRNKEKLKICTDPSEIKPLLNRMSTSKGSDLSKFDSSENSGGNESSSPNVISPTLCDIKSLKSQQYSVLFETACEIECYASHKKILPSESGDSKNEKRERVKSHGLKDQVSGKSHSATSSPVRHSKDLTSGLSSHQKRYASEMDTASTSKETSLWKEGSSDVLKSSSCRVLKDSETQSNTEPRQSSRSSNHSPNNGDEKVWEQASNEETFSKSNGQTMSSSSDAKQVIETTC